MKSGVSRAHTTGTCNGFLLQCCVLLCRLLCSPHWRPHPGGAFEFTGFYELERRDAKAIILNKTHIWADSLKVFCFLCPSQSLVPYIIEMGTFKMYTKVVLYLKNVFLSLNPSFRGLNHPPSYDSVVN